MVKGGFDVDYGLGWIAAEKQGSRPLNKRRHEHEVKDS